MKYADKLKLDKAKFQSCMSTGATAQKVDADQLFGQYMVVRGTPTLYLNGEPLEEMAKPDIDAKIKKLVSGG